VSSEPAEFYEVTGVAQRTRLQRIPWSVSGSGKRGIGALRRSFRDLAAGDLWLRHHCPKRCFRRRRKPWANVRGCSELSLRWVSNQSGKRQGIGRLGINFDRPPKNACDNCRCK